MEPGLPPPPPFSLLPVTTILPLLHTHTLSFTMTFLDNVALCRGLGACAQYSFVQLEFRVFKNTCKSILPLHCTYFFPYAQFVVLWSLWLDLVSPPFNNLTILQYLLSKEQIDITGRKVLGPSILHCANALLGKSIYAPSPAAEFNLPPLDFTS